MIESLQRFVVELRACGISVSPAEAIDAVRAAAAVGPEHREGFRAALSMTLAKDLRSTRVFAQAFERFFAASVAGEGDRERKGAGGGGAGRGGGEGSGGTRSRPTHEDPIPGKGGSPRPPAAAPRPGLRVLRGAEVRREIDGPRPQKPRPDGGDGRRERAARPDGRRTIPRDDPRGSGRREARGGPEGDREAPAAARRVRLSKLLASEKQDGESERPDVRRRDLASPLNEEDERRLAREIPRIVEEIRLRHSRRSRRAPRGRLWMKRALRENLKTGGVPFRIPMREVKPKRSRVVLLVDTSWSVARAAGLFLLIGLEFLRLDRKTQVFFFVNRPAEATEALRQWLRRPPPAPAGSARSVAGDSRDPARGRPGNGARHAVGRLVPPRTVRAGTGRRSKQGEAIAAGIVSPVSGRSFLEAIRSVPDLDPDAASDYGRVFYALASGALRGPRPDAVLLVLGDARSNFYDPLEWAFEAVASRCRRVIWLVPEPRSRWGAGDSVLHRYLPYCDVAVEARDLEGLAHGVRELLASLR